MTRHLAPGNIPQAQFSPSFAGPASPMPGSTDVLSPQVPGCKSQQTSSAADKLSRAELRGRGTVNVCSPYLSHLMQTLISQDPRSKNRIHDVIF